MSCEHNIVWNGILFFLNILSVLKVVLLLDIFLYVLLKFFFIIKVAPAYPKK